MIQVCEVGPRDGLQTETRRLSVDERVEMITRLVGSGLRYVECVSFVRDDLVPQMAGAEQVMARVPRVPGVRYAGLVLSAGGMERALTSEALTDVHVVVAASDTFNRKNTGRPTQDGLESLLPLIERARAAGKRVTGLVATAFGCPYEGEVAARRVLDIAAAYFDAGVEVVTLADTTGMAHPLQVRAMVRLFSDRFGRTPGLHTHNTRGMALANVFAGLQEGVCHFDSSVGGLGGCPFAPLAVGNACTEDLVHMLHTMGFRTGVDLGALIETAEWVQDRVGRTLDGLVMKAGPLPIALA
ncbi:MAG TPA: hydroxymethylglutaryl-CoA lyase [Alicyclobacillus sp.]|nr:hydroxymethylglutaryl-CoA lyase [Alicyclobacillus sp.]